MGGVLGDLASGNIGKALGSDLTGSNSILGKVGSSPIGRLAEAAAIAYATGDPEGFLSSGGQSLAQNIGITSVAGNLGLASGVTSLMNGGGIGNAVISGMTMYGLGSLGDLGNLSTPSTGPAPVEDRMAPQLTSAAPQATAPLQVPNPEAVPNYGPDPYAPPPSYTGQGFTTPPGQTPVQAATPAAVSQAIPSANPAVDAATRLGTPTPSGAQDIGFGPGNYTPQGTTGGGILNTIKNAYANASPYQLAGAGALGLMALKSAAKPNSVAAAKIPTQYINRYNYNPYSQQMTLASRTPACQFSAATGGIVALNSGGEAYQGRRFDAGGSTDPGVAPTQAQLDAVDAAYQAGNYAQAQNLVNQYGVTSADVSRYAPTFDQSILAGQGISLAGQDVLPAAVAANNVQSYNNPGYQGTNLTQAESEQIANAYNAKDYSAVQNMANLYGLTGSDASALYGSAYNPSALAAAGITLPGSTNASNAQVAATNLSLPVINQMYDAWQTGDYKTAQALATQSGLTSQDLSNLFPQFNQNELALAGIKLGLQPTQTQTLTNTGTGGGGGGYGGGATCCAARYASCARNPSYSNPATYAPNAIQNTPTATLMPGVGGNTGAGIFGGGTVVNPNGTITESPVLPGIPKGGFTGMTSLTNAYTQGGGSLGYTNNAPTSMDQFNQEYNTLTGGSAAAYNFLMGKTTQPKTPYTASGQVAIPYATAVMGSNAYVKDPNTGHYVLSKVTPLNKSGNPITDSRGIPVSANYDPSTGYYLGADGLYYSQNGMPMTPSSTSSTSTTNAAGGGLMALSGGGMSVGHLGGYSDGGRLLRGPGDGVSDSIPATIGSHNPEPARLADGEFVVPARIVSELGNGSTEAGARQLYKMMDRIQQARSKTTGKDAVATDTNASKYLPV